MQAEKMNITKEVKIRLTNLMENNEFRTNYNQLIGYYFQLLEHFVKDKEKLEEFQEVIMIAFNSQYYYGYSLGLEIIENNLEDIPNEFFTQEIGYFLFEVNNLVMGNIEDDAFIQFRTNPTKDLVTDLIIEFENILPALKESIIHLTLEGVKQCFLDHRQQFNVVTLESDTNSLFREQDVHHILSNRLISCEVIEPNVQIWKIYDSLNGEVGYGEILFINALSQGMQFVKFYLSMNLTPYQQDLIMERVYKTFEAQGYDLEKISFEKYLVQIK